MKQIMTMTLKSGIQKPQHNLVVAISSIYVINTGTLYAPLDYNVIILPTVTDFVWQYQQRKHCEIVNDIARATVYIGPNSADNPLAYRLDTINIHVDGSKPWPTTPKEDLTILSFINLHDENKRLMIFV